ncbi:MAG: 50S ribosomal protein L29 [Bacteroidetes bacterium]|nr:MAG: 50S ribosomal protein L29 [Bacteroidota bacterium]
MPSKKFLELQEFSDEELVNELAETETQYQKLKFDHAIKGLENPMVLREVRRDIARLKTELRRRQVEKMSEAELAKRSKIRQRRRRKS